MAKVPYSPVPDVAAQAPGEAISENTPSAAFGENIGSALQHLGTSVGDVGNELFTRAVALQDLRNEADAREAQTNFAIESSKLHAQFSSLEGKAAADGLQPYLDSQRQLRMQFRGQLKTPIAQRMFDADSLPFLQRNAFSAAGHAADASKSYVLNTYSAQSDIIKRQTEDDPNDDVAFQRNGEKLRNSTTQAAMIHFGTNNPNDLVVKNAVQKQMQSYVASKIKGIARDDPQRAMKILEENRSDLGDEYEPLQNVIETRGNVISSSNIADKILASHRQDDGTYDATYQQMQDEVREEAREQFPDNARLPDSAVSVFDTKIVRARFAAEQDKREALHQIDTAILTRNVSDTQELFAIPGMSEVVERYGKFDPKGAAELQSHIFNINQAANRITRNESLEYIYHGLANGGPDGKIDDFLKIDPFDPKWHLNVNDAKEVIAKQFQTSRSMQVDPKVNNALQAIIGSMGTQLDTLRVIGRERDINQYYAFKGALGAALEEWQMENKRPPSNEEIIQKIGPALVRQIATPKISVMGLPIPFTAGQEPEFQIMQEHIKNVVAAAQKQGKRVPSDDEIRRAYLQQTFQQLFGGSSGGSSSEPANSVPE